jgi:hypothetical protein
MNQKILLKYEKVMGMALRGEPNEAATAANIAAAMRKEHPWLEKGYEEKVKSADSRSEGEHRTPGRDTDGWTINDVFTMAREAANKAREFTHAMADTQAAVDMADNTAMHVFMEDSTQSWHINTVFSSSEIEDLSSMNPLQLRSYVDSLSERYREWLGELFLND